MKNEEWERLLALDYNTRGRRKSIYYSDSKIELDDVYEEDDLRNMGFDSKRDLGLPGMFP
jgi:hypothetical protein